MKTITMILVLVLAFGGVSLAATAKERLLTPVTAPAELTNKMVKGTDQAIKKGVEVGTFIGSGLVNDLNEFGKSIFTAATGHEFEPNKE